ncbi:MAG: SDR family oxidoreductase, partial [Mesorhizobium sp.]
IVAREVLPYLPDGGRIINIASELAYLGRASASVYCATKAALLGLTRSWARELAPRILVNAVAPGPTDTPLLGFEALSESQRALEITHPLGRIGRPDEIA